MIRRRVRRKVWRRGWKNIFFLLGFMIFIFGEKLLSYEFIVFFYIIILFDIKERIIKIKEINNHENVFSYHFLNFRIYYLFT